MNKFTSYLILGVLALATVPALLAQQNSYTQTNLTANVAGVAAHTDAQLSNPWGISFVPGDVFWIANNNGGTSTTYDAQGVKQTITAGIPVAAVNPCNPGCPTGTVANQSTDFGGALFLFDTEDGIVASWNGTLNAVTKVDNSAANAVYKGLALVNNAAGNFLLAANFRTGKVDVFDHNFAPATLSGGTFTDPGLPAGYAPHGIRVINNIVFVAYAMQDAPKHDPVLGAGLGLFDLFQTDGKFIRRGATGGTLNAPWGLALTPGTFGAFPNDLLVGNFGDGSINVYDSTGTFLDQIKDSNGGVIKNPGLWDLVFGGGGPSGDPNTLYFTAGGAAQTSGLFATLVPAAAAGTDFLLNLSAPSATVARGGSATINIGATASGGFNSPINLSCTGLPTGVTCAFTPASITPGGTASSAQLKIAVGSTYTPPPTGYTALGSFMGMGLLGLVYGARKRDQQGRARRTGIWALGSAVLVLGLLLAAVGCGSSSGNHTTPGQTVMVVGTSGAISHSTPLTLTIQ